MKHINNWLLAVTFLCIITSCNDTKQETTILKQTDFSLPPVAEMIPDTFTNFGQQRIDNYAWLRDKNNPKVIA
ncbi:MAG: hypothetical protein ITG04_00575, partial [Proteiniphilum sp.]|nr:hypothetical protein [Proteiniphilum sp.]